MAIPSVCPSVTQVDQSKIVEAPLHSTPLTGRAIKPQRQGHIGGPIAQP